MIDPIALARQLIDTPSPTDSEAPMSHFLLHTLHEQNYECRMQEVAPGRQNVFAGAGGRPRVILNSHIDTVPPWFQSRDEGEYLYGRGACDTKGIIAAMLAAGERLRNRGVRDFAFLFVVGEETDSIGAKSASSFFHDLGSEFVLVGEPTESTFARASKGAYTCIVRFRGVAGHSAYPERGDSAISKLVAAVAEINASSWGEDPVLGKGTVNVGVIRGGVKPNVIAGEAEAEMIFRLVTSMEEAHARLAAIAAKHGGEIVLSRGNAPQRMVVPEGGRSTVVSFNTDVPHLRSLGAPLLFGPGSILDAHGENERIAKKELLDSIDTYEQTVMALLEGRLAADR